MRDLFHLLLPALFPSWRFFKSIEPSPRIQWAVFETLDAPEPKWHELRRRPNRVSVVRMVWRLFWNPQWNETLFLVSCADRIEHGGTEHGVDEIFARVRSEISAQRSGFMQFRLVFVRREGIRLVEEVTFVSDARACRDLPPA